MRMMRNFIRQDDAGADFQRGGIIKAGHDNSLIWLAVMKLLGGNFKSLPGVW
jgi:hypothetical protein